LIARYKNAFDSYQYLLVIKRICQFDRCEFQLQKDREKEIQRTQSSYKLTIEKSSHWQIQSTIHSNSFLIGVKTFLYLNCAYASALSHLHTLYLSFALCIPLGYVINKCKFLFHSQKYQANGKKEKCRINENVRAYVFGSCHRQRAAQASLAKLHSEY